MIRILPILPLFFLPFTLYANNELNDAEFVHCYDFGCKSQHGLSYSDAQWDRLNDIFSKPALSAWQEKQLIRQAIALMEVFSGRAAGTDRDKAGNYPGADLPRQQDCIDESTNTMQYLYALQHRGLLHWHRVEGKKRRIVWFFTHWTAVISELDSGEQYAVDSWYRDNGEPPYIQQLSAWQRKQSFPDDLNP